MSALVILPFTAHYFARTNNSLRLIAGLMSIALGIYCAWEITSGLA